MYRVILVNPSEESNYSYLNVLITNSKKTVLKVCSVVVSFIHDQIWGYLVC